MANQMGQSKVKIYVYVNEAEGKIRGRCRYKGQWIEAATRTERLTKENLRDQVSLGKKYGRIPAKKYERAGERLVACYPFLLNLKRFGIVQ